MDRRVAVLANGLETVDELGIYAVDAMKSEIADGEARTNIVDFLRQAGHFSKLTLDGFYLHYLADLEPIADAEPTRPESAVVSDVFSMCQRHAR